MNINKLNGYNNLCVFKNAITQKQKNFKEKFFKQVSQDSLPSMMNGLENNGIWYNNFATIYCPDNKHPNYTLVGRSYDTFEPVSVDISPSEFKDIVELTKQKPNK